MVVAKRKNEFVDVAVGADEREDTCINTLLVLFSSCEWKLGLKFTTASMSPLDYMIPLCLYHCRRRKGRKERNKKIITHFTVMM